MKKHLLRLLVALLVLAAAAYLLYTPVIRQIAAARDDRTISEYHGRVRQIQTEGIQNRLDSAAVYNETLEEFHPEGLFSGREVLTAHRYEAPLNTGDGLMGVLAIPGIGLRLPVYHESADRKPTEKLVHVQGTPLPADKPGSNVMLAGPATLKAEGFPGDIGLRGERMLEDAERLTPGDLMILNVLDRTMVYRVESAQTIAAEGLSKADLAAGEDEDLLTLVTQRRDRLLMVRGKRVPAAEAVRELQGGDRAQPLPDWQGILLLGSPAILLGLIVMAITERIKKRSYRLPVEREVPEPEEPDEQKEREEKHEA